MTNSKAIQFSPKSVILSAGVALAFLSAAVVPATAQSGSENPMFRRHFWRGQAYHGTGYPAQVHEEARAGDRGLGASLEGSVVEGTRGAQIARDAAYCAGRYKSYDGSSGTYLGRGGRRVACP